MWKQEFQKPPLRYLISAQQVAITIAGSATSGTATINAVDTATSVIIPGGNITAATNSNGSFCSLTLTNPTAITATRNTGTASAPCTAYCTVLYLSRRLVKSVQYGSIILSSASSGTATITAVDTTKAAVINLGNTSNAGALNLTVLMRLTLTNPTTVTANSGGTATGTVQFVVIEFQPGVVTFLQQVSTTLTSTNLSDTATLSQGVDMNRAIVLSGGQSCGTSALNTMLYNVQLTAPATLTYTRNASATTTRTINVTVIELAQGIIRLIQRGTNSISGATSAALSIALSSQFFGWLHQLGFNTGGTTLATSMPGSQQSNDTTITSNLNSSGSAVPSYEAVWLR